jgi:hypothetical protein
MNSAELTPDAWDISKPALRILEGPAIIMNKWSPEIQKIYLELAVIYENIGDFAPAEEIYEFLLMEASWERPIALWIAVNEYILPHSIVSNLVHLPAFFRLRVSQMDYWEDNSEGDFQQRLPISYILHRALILDSKLLDTAFVQSLCQSLLTVPVYSYLLPFAARVGSARIVKKLLDADFHLETEDAEECTALYRVVERGWENIARVLLERGSYVNCRNKWQMTPLHIAVSNKHKAIVLLLLDFGADINARSHTGETPLAATLFVNDDIEQLLLSRGAKI